MEGLRDLEWGSTNPSWDGDEGEDEDEDKDKGE